MHERLVEVADLPGFVAALMRTQTVIAPVRRDGVASFERLATAAELELPANGLTRVSAKAALLPRTEVLFYYRADGKTEKTAAPPAPEPQVLFGVHPCDVQAIHVLDAVFGAEPFPDGPYLARRAKTTIVGLGTAAQRTDKSCFFSRFGISSMDNRDCDLFLTPFEDGVQALEVLTAKGAATLEAAGIELPDAAAATRTQLAERRAEAEAEVRHDLDVDALRTALPDAIFELPIWDETAQTCLGCGVCSYLCPTCHCFDVQDECRDGAGCRVRNWDTCQFALFTRHASDHNPRAAQTQRTRQRVMHKFVYGPKNLGRSFCVGCGRCIACCPAHLDLRQIIERIRQ